VILIECLLEPVGIELSSRAESMLAARLGEITAPLINVGNDGRARTLFRRGVPTAKATVSQAKRIEITLPRPQCVPTSKTLVIAAGLNQLL